MFAEVEKLMLEDRACLECGEAHCHCKRSTGRCTVWSRGARICTLCYDSNFKLNKVCKDMQGMQSLPYRASLQRSTSLVVQVVDCFECDKLHGTRGWPSSRTSSE
ncbi:unnamed protein product [Cladocopium goreaui]|uniref:Uncharacterized protein n=1 Tax=Cladocopium goreaui TaxID=2562237 RepID=A0A9P1FMC0_9DINO|nr:unnamed protein product [Cladocopium goreaui]